MVWIKHYLPAGGKFFLVGLAAICRAIWNLRNRACFEKKNCQVSYRDHLLYLCVLELLGRFTKGRGPAAAGSWCGGTAAQCSESTPRTRWNPRTGRRNCTGGAVKAAMKGGAWPGGSCIHGECCDNACFWWIVLGVVFTFPVIFVVLYFSKTCDNAFQTNVISSRR
jgi:hypothetical protein